MSNGCSKRMKYERYQETRLNGEKLHYVRKAVYLAEEVGNNP